MASPSKTVPEFAGSANSLYERHLVFDHIVDRNAASLRERFEAVAASVRDLLTQSWLNTDANYTRQNPKRV